MIGGGYRYLSAIGREYGSMLADVGLISMVSGGVIASVSVLALFMPIGAGGAVPYLTSGGTLAALGWMLTRLRVPGTRTSLGLVQGSVVVLGSWLFASMAATAVFIWAGELNFTRAFFESVSGWTTTGLTVVDEATASPGILLLRSVLQLAGGAGIAVVMLAALAGPPGTGLSAAEGRGEQLAPNVRTSAKLVLYLYGFFAVFGICALKIAGMGWFDAVNHSFAALSTGGFSTRSASIGYWDAASIEAVIVVLMILGNVSFVTSYAVTRGRWRWLTRNSEVRLLLLLLSGGFLLFLVSTSDLYAPGAASVRTAGFEAVTAVTTTGFTTTSYARWPALGWWALVLLMVVGGGAGSTAGGMKQFRIVVLWRGLVHEVQRRLRSRRLVGEPSIWHRGGKRFLGTDEIMQAGLFLFVYLVALGLGSAIIMAYGNGLRESVFEFSSALGTVGLSVGITGADAPDGVLWAETAGMLLGRLEFFTVLVALSRVTGDGRLAVEELTRSRSDQRPTLP